MHRAPLAAAASVSATQTSTPSAAATASASAAASRAPVMATLAGTGAQGFSGDGAAATSALLSGPSSLVVLPSGDVVVADSANNRVRLVSASTGVIYTMAGTGTRGFSGDGGAATSASLTYPFGVALHPSGGVAIADTDNNRVRLVSASTGAISTIAGSSVAGFAGDGGPATSAALGRPHGVAFAPSGDMAIVEFGNHRVRMVSAVTGLIASIAGSGSAGFSGDGGPATSARLFSPVSAAFDAAGNLFVSERDNHRVRRVAASTGVITTAVGNGVAAFSGDGGAASSASLSSPPGIALDASGDLLIADSGNNRVRRLVVGGGTIATAAGTGALGSGGDGGPATSASVASPIGVAAGAAAALLIAEYQGQRVRRAALPDRPSPSPSRSPSATPYCAPALFRTLPRTDLVGTLVGTALAPGAAAAAASAEACREACCNAVVCDGFAFDASALRWLGAGECYLYANVTQLIPSSGYASGLLEAALLAAAAAGEAPDAAVARLTIRGRRVASLLSASGTPTASVTRSLTAAATSSATGTGASSSTGTSSSMGTGSSTGTGSPTGAATGSASSSSSCTSTSTATNTQAPASSSATGTGSSSSTGTGSQTGAASASGSSSSAGTATSTGSSSPPRETASLSSGATDAATGSPTGAPPRTPSASLSAAGSRSRSSSHLVTASASRRHSQSPAPSSSASGSRSLSATRTSISTRSRSRSASRKRKL